MAVTTVTDVVSNASRITDDGNTVYLEKRSLTYTGGRTTTQDIWTGTRLAVKEFFNQLRDNTDVSNMTFNPNGRKGTLTVDWRVAFTEGSTPIDDPDVIETNEWSIDPIEIPTPLVAHPYFQVAYIAGSGEVIEDEIARCESFIKRGKAYTASGTYEDWVKRYYGLRMAGVEEYIQMGLEISRKYTVNSEEDVKSALEKVGQVLNINDLVIAGMPNDLASVIRSIPKITDYTSADPTTFVTAPSLFEFVVRMPTINVSNNLTTYEIDARFIGLEKWSSVIYPNGSWDPPVTT